MAKQQSIEQAREEGRLQLEKWADIMIQRIRMNFKVQRIWPKGGGPYKGYYIINMARSKKYRSTGAAYAKQNLYAKVVNGAGGNTVAVDFFFRRYLLFVDWGVGGGQKKAQVPDEGIPKMKKRYATWSMTGDRQRRPVIMGAIKGGRFFLANILEEYWQQRSEATILYGLGVTDEQGNYKELVGGLE